MKTGLTIASAMILAALQISASRASQEPTLRGQVLMPDGSPVSRELRLVLDDSESFRTQEIVYTDSNGRFAIPNLPAGSYRITVPSDGPEFATTLQTIRLDVSVNSYVVISLLPARGGTGRPRAEAVDIRIPAGAREHYARAIEHLGRREKARAEEQLLKALAIHADYFQARNDLGMLFLEGKRFEAAEAELRRAVQLNPGDFRPRFNLGVACLKQLKLEDAASELEQVLQQRPDLAGGHYYLGVSYYGLRRFEEAETHLTKAYDLQPREQVESLMFLGNIYYLQEDPQRALKSFETYLQALPQAPNAEEVRQVIEKLRKEKTKP